MWSWEIVLISIYTYCSTHSRWGIIMTGVLRRISGISLVSYNVAHLHLVTLALFKWTTSTLTFTQFPQIHAWIRVLRLTFFILFQYLLSIITMTLSTHHTLMPLATSLIIQLCIFCTWMHHSLWLGSWLIYSDKATWTLQTVTKLWIMHWISIKLLLIIINRSISIHWALSRIDISLTIL